MFHCTILFALKPGISLVRVRAAREALQALIETMPGVAHLTVTHNIADERQGYNLALFSGFGATLATSRVAATKTSTCKCSAPTSP